MPVPINLIRDSKWGLDKESLKSAFTVKNIKKDSEVDKLVKRIACSIRDGIEINKRDYRLYKTMDWAMDQPFYQISYTQLRGLLSSEPDDKKVLETVNQWGLTHLLPDQLNADGTPCCDQRGVPKKAINLPFLTNIYIPIVMAYHTIRWAKLFNERDQHPLYKYSPSQYTKENQLRCEIITQLAQKQSDWFDYKSDLRQNIYQTLQYGVCINFPREAWYVEKQLDSSGKEKIVKEGIRFNMPHPSRVYYDLFHRLSTLNSNTGCRYAGYWEIGRYGEIVSNKSYWNKDSIQVGSSSSWLTSTGNEFLNTVYPCTMSFPSSGGMGTGGLGGAGELDREAAASRLYSQDVDANAATLVSQHFERIIPAECGLGKYEYPVWFRFVMASDNAVIWAEPLAYDRFPTYAYDADFNRSRFRSLSLEVLPFQDQIGNILSQWNAAVRENLRNPVFVDKEKVPTQALIALKNQGNKTYSGREYIPFSSTENYRTKVNQAEAFFTPTLTHHNTSELAQLITGILDMLDRIMQLSPQEIGQAASHEQTAEESRIINSNMSTRVSFTGSFIDSAEQAKKVMIYDAMMAYADEDITVGVSTSMATTMEEMKKLCENLGFSISDKSVQDEKTSVPMVTISGKKDSLAIESFSSSRGEINRVSEPAVADAMSKIFIAVANNEFIVRSIGAKQLVEMMNQIIQSSGAFPKEFRLQGSEIDPAAQQEEQQMQLQELMKGFSEQVRAAIDQSQQQTLEAAAQQTTQIVQQAMSSASEQIAPMAEAVATANQVNQIQEQKLEKLAQSVMQLNQAVTVALEQLKMQQVQQQAAVQQEPPSFAPSDYTPVGVPV